MTAVHGILMGGCLVWERGLGVRASKKNLRKMWYALYDAQVPILDEDGNPTFEYEPGYLEPVEFKANLSSGSSDSQEQPFGANVKYDRILLLYDMECPINEHSRIWVKKDPYEKGIFDPETADYEVAATPLDSLNVLRIAIKRRVNGNDT